MIITSSPDITVLDFDVIWDISGTLPAISLTNQSAGTGLANCTWWFVAKSPTQTLIHEGSEADPDITGSWSTTTLSDAWPRPFNQIEWSGAPYSIIMYVKDSAGNVYSIEKIADICRPYGNTNLSKNMYGVASLTLQVKCDQARIFFQDTTNQSYKGMDGEQISSSLKVVYPIDETGNVPAPFSMVNFSAALVPISYSSDSYQYMQSTVYEYDYGGGVYVRIKYQSRSKNGAAAVSFPVLCNIDLCPLVCEVSKLVDSIENGSCANVEDANRKLTLINPKLLTALIGKQEPLCGVDVPSLVEEIKAIGGFDCDCCSAPTGIIPQVASVIDGYTFSIVPVCGDVSGTVTVAGPNIQLNLQDKSYTFEIDNDSPSDINAFEFVTEINGCTKNTKLRTNGNQLAQDLAAIIAANPDTLNQWNELFQFQSGMTLIVDGGCIFQSTSTCDYTLTLLNIPINTTYALLNRIKIGDNNISINYLFNLTNLPALQTYLNGLGYGTFAVTNPSGQTVVITSAANPNDIQSLGYRISNTQYTAEYERQCDGYIPIDANEVVQKILNYLCDIDDSQVFTSKVYGVKYIDVEGAEQTITIPEGSTLAELFDAFILSNNNTLANIGEVAGVSCNSMKSLFDDSNASIGPNDYVLATRGNGEFCSRINLLDLFNFVLSSGVNSNTTKELFCNFVTACGAGLTCAPYNYFNVLVTSYDSSCTPIVGIEYTLN